MGKQFCHFTHLDRLRLEKELSKKTKIKEIVRILDKSVNAVYYELKRSGVWYEKLNSDLTTKPAYSAEIAQRQYEQNLRAKGADLKIGKDYALAEFLEHEMLEGKLSPEACLNKIKNEKLKFSVEIKSVQTLYSYVRKGVFRDLEMINLPLPRKPRKERIVRLRKSCRGTSIEERNKEILEREDFGNWEMDTVVSCRGGKGSLLVFTERKTRYEMIEYLPSHTVEGVLKALNRIEREMGAKFYRVFQTVTSDNGAEFADFESMMKARYRKGKRFEHYYCHSYSSWERGSNENQNRFIRRWFPKGTDFSKVMTRKRAKELQDWINDYPREMFCGQTSRQRYEEELSLLRGG